MSIEAIASLFSAADEDSLPELPDFPPNVTEEGIFRIIRREAAKAMIAAGCPPDHPLDDRIGRVVAHRLWLRHTGQNVLELSPIETEIREVLR